MAFKCADMQISNVQMRKNSRYADFRCADMQVNV
jgi:hypothetical protein